MDGEPDIPDVICPIFQVKISKVEDSILGGDKTLDSE